MYSKFSNNKVFTNYKTLCICILKNTDAGSKNKISKKQQLSSWIVSIYGDTTDYVELVYKCLACLIQLPQPDHSQWTRRISSEL